ncbi:type I-D CRISPR-associated helicase Cas3' [Cyanobacterium aponinum]|uniref:type I-D CRISPR-associated helicase Cas3' n=1 Tax=Cyanobacterium aponinum TaxID=379064 RepID=UPI000C12AA6C|nr:type I-D CRISPR-associated helicase Cas3' [Cyanobacterium aponinum]PHV64108.1 type I-D CRISPR-associated helicase Cas3' [Cyanobacterium aponinum IPPAS B-1201]
MNNHNISIKLEARSIAKCGILPPELEFMQTALQHQVDVFEQAKTHDLILDLAPTGTGKTKAGLSTLLHNPSKTAIYVAPTNALITQQTEAAIKFVKEANLPHIVKSASAKEIKQWSDNRVGRRSGEKLYNVLRNPSTIFPEIGENKPLLLVTNPDIFYYATFFAYNHLDKDNIASQFYSKFSTVIFDEFHLYSAKQLVSLFFYLALSHVFGYFKHNRKIILLTATPEPASNEALKLLGQEGVKIAYVDGESENKNLIPSQTAVNLEIRPLLDKDILLTEIKEEVLKKISNYPEQNGAVILDSLVQINDLAKLLEGKNLKSYFGRITGSTSQAERAISAQKQVILATSTVDVGFNFEKNPQPDRQNLDWLIFSAKDYFSFWQRLGRVGRVLGKKITNISSDAIAYLPSKAWEENITDLDIQGGRKALTEKLEKLVCLQRPFLDIYWKSEAFLEIAKPLLELEEKLESLPESNLVFTLFQTMQNILGGKRNWKYYCYRMKILKGAENISKSSIKDIQNKWKYIKGGQIFVKNYLKAKYPEDYENIKKGINKIEEFESVFKEHRDVAEDLKEYAEIFTATYAPLFQFRESLFESLLIKDPHNFLVDEVDETILDPIHLLRYYEFINNGDYIEITSRAKDIYQLNFSLRYFGTNEEFKNNELNKLTAWKNCRIARTLGSAIAPTPLIEKLEKKLIPGVIISTAINQGIIIQLRKQGLISYPINVRCKDISKEYTFFPTLSGILTIIMAGFRLSLPDKEDFYIA